MDVAAVKEHCSGYPGASSKLFGPPSNVLVYYVGGRKFAYFKISEPEKWRFSICASPERFLELTDVPGIVVLHQGTLRPFKAAAIRHCG